MLYVFLAPLSWSLQPGPSGAASSAAHAPELRHQHATVVLAAQEGKEVQGTHRLALWALKVGHLLALHLCQIDALWVVPAGCSTCFSSLMPQAGSTSKGPTMVYTSWRGRLAE